MTQEFMSVREVCEALEVSRAMVQKLEASGDGGIVLPPAEHPWRRRFEHMRVESIPKALAAFVGNAELEAFGPRQFIAAGDNVVAHARIAYTVKRTGKRVDEEQLHWWTVRDGKIARLRHFEDTAQVMAAGRT